MSIAERGRLRRVTATVEVARPADELFYYWRNFGNLPCFMERLSSVTVIDPLYSRWSTQDGGTAPAAWEVEIVAEVADELIAWCSIGQGAGNFDGTVRFFPASNGIGTRVWLEIASREGTPPASLLGPEPDRQIHEDLGRFERIMAADQGSSSPGESEDRADYTVGSAGFRLSR